MRTNIIYFFIFTFVFISCKTDTKTLALEKAKSEKIDSLAHRYLELNRFSGMILVAKNDTVIYNHSFGLADYENSVPFSDKTAFKIGEITGLVTENILNYLVKKGKIQPTDSISNYIGESVSHITLNELLNNKDSIDYNTLGKIIENVSGKSYQKNIEDLSDDLGLENTYFKKTESLVAVGYLYHNYRGNGLELQKSPIYNLDNAFSEKGLKSTANDLVKILKSNPKDLSIHGYLDDDGFSYSLVKDTISNVSIIVLSNRRHPVAKEISNSINAILRNKSYRLPLARKPFDIDKSLLKYYAGYYALNEDMNLEVLNENDSLFVMMGSNKIHLIPQSEKQFYMEQMDASMRFLKDTGDKVNEVVLLDGFLDGNRIKRVEDWNYGQK